MKYFYFFIILLISYSLTFASSSGSEGQLSLPEFEQIREHIENIPKEAEESLESLAEYLIKLAKNDTEKAYAIYYWLTNNIEYDVKGLQSGSLGDLSPAGVLRRKMAVCSGYSRLFVDLGRKARLEVEEITGDAKGYGGLDNGRHAWNAVKIKGEWKLLDATWAAGSLVDNKFSRMQQDYYFFTKPEQLIYSHLPDDDKWQLLSKPISKQNFINKVELKSNFFGFNLELNSHKKSLISTDKEIHITLKSSENIIFTSTLFDSSLNKLDRHSFTQRKEGKQSFHVSFPKDGMYKLSIFANHIKNSGSNYKQILKYNINVNNLHGVIRTYPKKYLTFSKSKALLYQPLSSNLKRGKEYEFEIMVPNASDVAVIEKNDTDKPKFHHLDKNGDIFSGKIIITGTRLSISTKLDPQKNSFSGLLTYKVK